jgi:hypothetical protein
MGAGSSLERLRLLIWNLSSYSNSRIVEIAKGFVDMSKESETMAGDSHQAFVDCLSSSYAAGESRRCLALLYVCNEILTSCPREDSWHAVLATAISKYVPLICGLALRQQENNVVLNVMRLPEVWKQHEVFTAELCNQMKVQCDIHHQGFIEEQQQRDRLRWMEAARRDMTRPDMRDMRPDAMLPAPVAGGGAMGSGIMRGAGALGGAVWPMHAPRDIVDRWMDVAQDDGGLGGASGGLALAGGAGGLEGDGREGLDDVVTGPAMDEDLDFLSSLVGAADSATRDRGANMTTRAGGGAGGGVPRGIGLIAIPPPPPPPPVGGLGMGVAGLGGGAAGLQVAAEVEAGGPQGVGAGGGRMEGSSRAEVQHLEELKLKEIAEERASFVKLKESTIQGMFETHGARLTACRSQSETKKVMRQNEDEMTAVEAELERVLAQKERHWAAALLSWYVSCMLTDADVC